MATKESNKNSFCLIFQHFYMHYLPRLVCLSLGSKTLATLLDSRLENRNIVYPFYSWDQTTLFSILSHSLDSFPLCTLGTHSHPTFSAIFFKNDAIALNIYLMQETFLPHHSNLKQSSAINMNKSLIRAKWKRINEYNWQLTNHRCVLYILF